MGECVTMTDGGETKEKAGEEFGDEVDEVPTSAPEIERVSAAVMVSFGEVHVGREALAADTFVTFSRYLGRLLADGDISGFRPYLIADGQLGDVSGFFLLEGEREHLDELRRRPEFQRELLRAGACTHNVQAHTLLAGSDAGRAVNLFREVREELGLI